MSRMQARLLGDGARLHLNDGPIDLIISADGERQKAFAAAVRRFETVLDELCAELPLLRGPVSRKPKGTVAERMWRATLPFGRDSFITPMAAVAGAVAEEILGAMTASARLTRASVNNGGDIALHLAEGESFDIGLVDRPDRPSLFSKARIAASDGVHGIATSGWRGRSFSLGIADAVTVLAVSAAEADAAATMIANTVDLPGHPAVARVPASEVQPGSDLGERLVTHDVGHLLPAEKQTALAGGVELAEQLMRDGLITAAALHLQGETRYVQSVEQRTLVHA